MRKRTAKKVVARFGELGWASRRDLVVKAHRKLGLEVPPRPPSPVESEVVKQDPEPPPPEVVGSGLGANESTPPAGISTDSSVAELRAEAKARGLSGYSKMKKADLLDLLAEGAG